MKRLETIKTMNEDMLKMINYLMGIFIDEVENGIIPMDNDFMHFMDILVNAMSDGFKVKYRIRCIKAAYENGKISEDTFNRDVDDLAKAIQHFSKESFENCYDFLRKMSEDI